MSANENHRDTGNKEAFNLACGCVPDVTGKGIYRDKLAQCIRHYLPNFLCAMEEVVQISYHLDSSEKTEEEMEQWAQSFTGEMNAWQRLAYLQGRKDKSEGKQEVPPYKNYLPNYTVLCSFWLRGYNK